MANSQRLTFDDLKDLTGYTRPADIERCLQNQGVPFLRGKDGKPFTINDALRQAMGIRESTPANNSQAVEFDF